jgi:hypothetical protein
MGFRTIRAAEKKQQYDGTEGKTAFLPMPADMLITFAASHESGRIHSSYKLTWPFSLDGFKHTYFRKHENPDSSRKRENPDNQ